MVFEKLNPRQYIALLENKQTLIDGERYCSISINVQALDVIKVGLICKRNKYNGPLSRDDQIEFDDNEKVIEAISKIYDVASE